MLVNGQIENTLEFLGHLIAVSYLLLPAKKKSSQSPCLRDRQGHLPSNFIYKAGDGPSWAEPAVWISDPCPSSSRCQFKDSDEPRVTNGDRHRAIVTSRLFARQELWSVLSQGSPYWSCRTTSLIWEGLSLFQASRILKLGNCCSEDILSYVLSYAIFVELVAIARLVEKLC